MIDKSLNSKFLSFRFLKTVGFFGLISCCSHAGVNAQDNSSTDPFQMQVTPSSPTSQDASNLPNDNYYTPVQTGNGAVIIPEGGFTNRGYGGYGEYHRAEYNREEQNRVEGNVQANKREESNVESKQLEDKRTQEKLQTNRVQSQQLDRQRQDARLQQNRVQSQELDRRREDTHREDNRRR